MLIYPSHTNFSLDKGKLHFMENRDPMVIVFLESSSCELCKANKKMLYQLSDTFPEISFAVINVTKHPQILETLNLAQLKVDYVPAFLLFKLGIFQKFLNISMLSKEIIRKELLYELDAAPILSKNSGYSKNYLRF